MGATRNILRIGPVATSQTPRLRRRQCPAKTAGPSRRARRRSDTQSFAHRSAADTPDSATVRPFIHGGDSDWVSYGRSPGDGGARVMSTKGQELRRQQTPPVAPAFNRYADRPLGTGDLQAPDVYGDEVQEVWRNREDDSHYDARVIEGIFCEKCCPACHPGD